MLRVDALDGAVPARIFATGATRPRSADKPEWLERISELKDLVQRHINIEENKMFPAARKLLDNRRAEELGRQIEELKQKESS
jgi:hemerythrin-like domain-containing protein